MTLMAAATGALAASWNGIVMSEVAVLVPREMVGEATAGCTLVIFLGYLVGPSVFSLLVAAGVSWRLAFLCVTAQLRLTATVVAAALIRQGRGGGRGALIWSHALPAVTSVHGSSVLAGGRNPALVWGGVRREDWRNRSNPPV